MTINEKKELFESVVKVNCEMVINNILSESEYFAILKISSAELTPDEIRNTAVAFFNQKIAEALSKRLQTHQ